MTDTIASKLSPMMAQWQACKEKAQGALLLFRLGDFYEAFYEDATLLAKELDLTLTKRQEIPMAGVPFHTAEAYIDKLVGKGFHVAVAEQVEDPKLAKGLVKREIVRIVTPGTLTTSSLLSEKKSNYLIALSELNSLFGLSLLDLSTGEFRVLEIENKKQLIDELSSLTPVELLLSSKWQKNRSPILEELQTLFSCSFTFKEDWYFEHEGALSVLMKHFRVASLDGFGLKGKVAAINAAGALFLYIKEDLNLSLSHVQEIRTEELSAFMAIDRATQRHLELTHSSSDAKDAPTLLNLLDRTETPMGARLLKQWVTHPLLSVDAIYKRQEAIHDFFKEPLAAEAIGRNLTEVRDLERLIMRIETNLASPRDLVGLRFSLEKVPLLLVHLQKFSSTLVVEDRTKLVDMSPLTEKIKSALVEAPPLRLTEGGIFKRGYDAELDELLELKTNNHDWIARYQTELRERTGVKTLKVGFTRAFGYYIEVGRGHAEKLQGDFERKQTLVNAERFITRALKEYEHKMLTAEERMIALETALFAMLREEVAQHAAQVREMAQAIARIDCLLSLFVVARDRGYISPHVDESDLLDVREGRHPMLEAQLLGERFISNDLILDQERSRLVILTGPNMAGKSTYLRQVALIVILAQIGSFVPAKSAHIGIIDKVFSRIGASDDLARGQSTFMVEMTETANILHNATNRSLVILDEIGRGTSTYDGISIAWAVAESLLTRQGKSPKTLFATHYWELTGLEREIPGAVNYHVAVEEGKERITFLRKIVKGSTDKSYGIHVARLAGIPPYVIRRAEEILVKLEKSPSRKQLKLDEQLPLFQ